MYVLGLTGSIGMGKSATAKMFRRLGVPVHDADAAVHKLLVKGGKAVPAIAREFPDAVRDGAVDRQVLGQYVFGNDAALKRLEAIIHPLVGAEKQRFLQICRRRRDPLVVLDIPLLFETGGDKQCDGVVVVSAGASLQKKRVLARPGMTLEKFRAILKKQMPDIEKRRRATYIISTGAGFRSAFNDVKNIVMQIKKGR